MEKTENERLVIAITGRRPVSIDPQMWPQVTYAREGGSVEQPDEHVIRVRRHLDGRMLVYGRFSSQWANVRTLYAGELLAPGALDGQIQAAIESVNVEIGGPVWMVQDILDGLEPSELA